MPIGPPAGPARLPPGLSIELRRGDITAQPDLDAIVNAANAALLPGGGVAGAIHRAAGPDLADECRPLAPIRPGEAVLTAGHALPNRFVIHCLGPVYGEDEPAAELLAACYRNALALAGAHAIARIGFPAISTGIFGYPMEEAAAVAFDAILAPGAAPPGLTLIRFVLFDAAALSVHLAALRARLAPDSPAGK
ncbi:MAG: macro domain-containing protein [Acetobacteraceae bacterium]